MNKSRLISAMQTIQLQLNLRRASIVQEVYEVLETKKEKSEISALIDTYWEESTFMLSLIEPYLEKLKSNSRILEVGAGTGILSHIILNAGYDISCIEPGANSFGFMPDLARAIDNALSACGLETALIEDEIIEQYGDNQFEFIFSAHVLEHVANKSESFASLARLIHPTGLMLHLCPNYLVPYEPHVGRFLIPFIGAKNKLFFKKSYREHTEIWDGINFINSSQVRNLALQNGLEVIYQNDIFRFYLQRYSEKSELQNRHTGGLFRIVVKLSLFLKIEKILPGAWQSPMLFELRKVQAT